MFVLVQILFALSIVSFSLCLYLLLNQTKSTFVFKHRRKMILTTFAASFVFGMLSCFAHGHFLFFSLDAAELLSDSLVWVISCIFGFFILIKLSGKIFHWERLPKDGDTKVESVRINKDDIDIQVYAPLAPSRRDFRERTAKQIGVWKHDGVTDYIVFSCAVTKSDMVADIYKPENSDTYFCDNALILSKDSVVQTILNIGNWIARAMFIAGILLANYQTYYLPKGSQLPENSGASSLAVYAFIFLLCSWCIRWFNKMKGFPKVLMCGFGWFGVVIATLSLLFVLFDPSTYNDIFTVYDSAGNIIHMLK